MSMRISQYVDPQSVHATLHIEGSVWAHEARLLEDVCAELQQQSVSEITLDFTGVTYIDEAGAARVRRLRQQKGVLLCGHQLFIRELIEGSHEQS